MKHRDLDDAEADALATFLTRTVDRDRYPLSPRLDPVKSILAKLVPQPVPHPLPPLKVYGPPRATGARRRRR
jgi:hypothetical protein